MSSISLSSTNGRKMPLKAVFDFKNLDPKERLVLLYLLDQAGDGNSVSLQDFVSATCLSTSSVQRTLNSLVKSGYILRQHCFKDGAQLANSYKLTNLAFDQYAATLECSTARTRH